MASQRFDLQAFVVGLIKFIFGVAIALFIIGLAGTATARYFLTQLATLPERPVFENDSSGAKPAGGEATKATPAPSEAAGQAPQASSEPAASDEDVLFQAIVTYGGGLSIRTGAGVEYETIDGIDYDETMDVLEEAGRWYKIRTSSGVEGWIKGRDNTQRL